MVVSILLLLVLGLVFVVPRLACLPCPRLNGIVPPGEEGVIGDPGDAGLIDALVKPPPLLMAASRPDASPDGESGVPKPSEGVCGLEA